VQLHARLAGSEQLSAIAQVEASSIFEQIHEKSYLSAHASISVQVDGSVGSVQLQVASLSSRQFEAIEHVDASLGSEQ
jgi:hypothetical protein